jgi:hypothetical protein
VQQGTAEAFSAEEVEQQLRDDIGQFYADPYGFVMYAFPWGHGVLSQHTGPDEWQAKQLMEIGEAIKADPDNYSIQEAIASGHGIGKSAEVAWIVLWAMSTRPHLAGWVTANTQNQLTKKTWREVSVWHNRAINKHWFKWTATRFYQVDHAETWGIDAIPWSKDNSEAFAGLHERYVLIIMDEASGIDNIIWEVSEGAMTTPMAMWFVFGNPTQNTGRFRECFGSRKKRWNTRQIDSRQCKMTNKAKIQQWLEDEGEDSDFFRVRVRGVFPRLGSTQLINSESVLAAQNEKLDVDEYIYHPMVMGVDVARFGQDETVISIRQGRKLLEQIKYRGLDNMQVSGRVGEIYRKYGRVSTIFIDEVGVGAGVMDFLRMKSYPVIGINGGSKADEDKKYFNRNAEMWHRMKEWIEGGADIPNDNDLGEQLYSRNYDYDPKERIRLEKKDDMKERGLASPDRADSLAMTFAQNVHLSTEPDYFEPDDD